MAEQQATSLAGSDKSFLIAAKGFQMTPASDFFNQPILSSEK